MPFEPNERLDLIFGHALALSARQVEARTKRALWSFLRQSQQCAPIPHRKLR